jgi:hypothetical protein
MYYVHTLCCEFFFNYTLCRKLQLMAIPMYTQAGSEPTIAIVSYYMESVCPDLFAVSQMFL